MPIYFETQQDKYIKFENKLLRIVARYWIEDGEPPVTEQYYFWLVGRSTQSEDCVIPIRCAFAETFGNELSDIDRCFIAEFIEDNWGGWDFGVGDIPAKDYPYNDLAGAFGVLVGNEISIDSFLRLVGLENTDE